MEHLPTEIIEQIAFYASSMSIYCTCTGMMKKRTERIVSTQSHNNEFLYNIPTLLVAIRCFLKRIKYRQYDGLREFLITHNTLVPKFYILAITFMEKKEYKKLFRILDLPDFIESCSWETIHNDTQQPLKKTYGKREAKYVHAFHKLLQDACACLQEHDMKDIFTDCENTLQQPSIDDAILCTQRCIDHIYNSRRAASPMLYKEIMSRYNDEEIAFTVFMRAHKGSLSLLEDRIIKIQARKNKNKCRTFSRYLFGEMISALAVMKKDDLIHELLIQHSLEDKNCRLANQGDHIARCIITNHPQFVIKLVEYGNFNRLLRAFRRNYVMLPHNVLECLSKAPSYRRERYISSDCDEECVSYRTLTDSVKRYGAQDLENKLHLLIEDGAEKRAVNYLCKCPFDDKVSATIAACVFSLYIKRMTSKENPRMFCSIITKTCAMLLHYMRAELSNLSCYMIVFRKIVENVDCSWHNIIDFYEVIVELSGLTHREWSKDEWSEEELSKETIMREYEIARSRKKGVSYSEDIRKYRHVIKALNDIDASKAFEFDKGLGICRR